MEAQYKNDMFVATLVNPNATLQDFVASGLNSDNTNLLTPEEYKQTKVVKEQFSKDGVFDDQKFNDAYALAAYKYQNLADDNAIDKLVNLITYDSNSRYAEFDKIREDQPIVTKIQNPFDEKIGISSLFGESASNKSMRELAQMNTHYFDWDKQKWVEESPDQFGLSSLLKDTMVYAQWDEDGTHVDPATNKVVSHKKGQWKTDSEGKFYLETLGDREIYGKQVLSALDTLVSENSSMQNFAFWESDEREKSVMGTTMNLVAHIAPFFIPGFNTYWGGLHMLWGLSSVLPTFYKAAEGFFLGDTHSSLWEGANKAEGWFSKYEQSLSEEAQDSFWNYEQMSKMIGDVFSQIYEQRAAAKMATKLMQAEKKSLAQLSNLQETHQKEIMDFMIAHGGQPTMEDTQKFFMKLYKSTPEYNKLASTERFLAKSASLGYMALTQAEDVYGQALQAGYDERAAGFAALLAASGQYLLMMNNRMGDWFMKGIFGYEESGLEKTITKAIMPYVKELGTQMQKIETAVTKEAKRSASQKAASVVTSIKNLFKDLYKNVKYGTEDFWGRAGIESVEEVTEEVAIDLAKGATDLLSWLGFWSQNGDFYDEEHPFLSKATLDRYVTSAVGGFVGGALFEFNDRFINQRINKELPYKDLRNLQELVADGKTKDIISVIRKITKNGPKLSFSPLQINTSNGMQTVYATADGETSQGATIGQVLENYVMWLDGIMNQEDLKQDKDSILRKSLLNTQLVKLFNDSGLNNYIFEEFYDGVGKLTETIGKVQSQGDKKISKELEDELKERRKVVKDIIEGKNQEKYMKLASFVLNPDIKQAFDDMDIFSFTQYKYDKKYDQLTDEEIETVKNDYEEFVKSKDYKKFLDVRMKAFEALEGDLSVAMKQFINSNYDVIRRQTIDKLYSKFSYDKLGQAITQFIDSDLVDQLLNLGSNEFDKETAKGALTAAMLNGNVLEELEKIYTQIATTPEIEAQAKPIYEEILNNLNSVKARLAYYHNNAITSGETGINLEELLNVSLVEGLGKNLPTEVAQIYVQALENNQSNLPDEEKKSPEEIAKKAKELTEKFKQHIDNYVQNFPITTLTKPVVIDILNNALGSIVDPELSLINSVTFTTAENTEIPLINAKLNSVIDSINLELYTLENFLKNSDIIDSVVLDRYVEIVSQKLKLDISNAVINLNQNLKLNIEFSNSEIESFVRKFSENPSLDTVKQIKEQIRTLYVSKFLQEESNKLKDSLDTSGTKYDIAQAQTKQDVYNFVDQQSVDKYSKHFYELILNQQIQLIENLIYEYQPEIIDLSFNEDVVDILLKSSKINNSTIFSNDDDLYFEQYNDLDTIINKPLVENNLYQLLDNLQIYFGNPETKSIFKILKDFRADLNKLPFDQFILSQISEDSIKAAISTIKMLKAVVSGMISQEIDALHPFGFNSAIIAYLNKYEGGKNVDKYVTLDQEQASVILSDLERLEQRLEFVSTISQLNENNQFAPHLKSKEAYFKVILERCKKAISKTQPKFVLDNIKKIILDEDLSDEAKFIQFSKALYDNYYVNQSPNKLKDLLNEFDIKLDKDFALRKSKGLSDLTKSISDYNLAIHLTAIVSDDPLKFYKNYIEELVEQQQKDEKEQKAPLFGQELALQILTSFVNNNNEFKKLYEFIPQEHVEHIVNGSAIYYLSAIGGAGKTSTIAHHAFSILLKNKKKLNVEFYAPSKRARQNLISSVLGDKVDDSNISYTKEGKNAEALLGLFVKNAKDILQEINQANNGTLKDPKYLKYRNNQKIYEIDQSKIEFIKKDLPDIVFLDESTNLDRQVFEIFNVIANTTNTKFISFGDNSQIGKLSSIDDVFTISPIELELSLRDLNNLKKSNNEQIHTIIKSIIGEQILTESVLTEKIKGPISLKYYESGDKIIGEKIITQFSDELKIIAKQMSENKAITLGIISETGTISTELETALKDAGISNYTLYTTNSNSDDAFQGSEATYVIADKLNFNSKNYVEKFLNLKKFYTAISRSFNATILFDPNEELLNQYNIASVKDSNYKIIENFSSEFKKKLLQKRIDELSAITNFQPVNAETSEQEETEQIPQLSQETIDKINSEVEKEPVDDHVTEDEIQEQGLSNDETSEDFPQLDDDIPEEKDSIKPKKIESGNTEFTQLYIYPFYVRLGSGTETISGFKPSSNLTEEINILPIESKSEYTKEDIQDFILLKNALSLYSKRGLKEKLKNNMYNSVLNKLHIQDIDQFVENMSKVYIVASKYDSSKDDPYKAFQYGTHEKLKDGDTFIRMVRDVKVGDQVFQITIAVLPALDTLREARDKGVVTNDTFSAYNKLCTYVNNNVSQGNSLKIELSKSLDTQSYSLGGITYITKLRHDNVDPNEKRDQAIPLSEFPNHGLWIDSISLFDQTTYNDFLNNYVAEFVMQQDGESNAEYLKRKAKIKGKLDGKFGTNGKKLKGLPIVSVFLTPDHHIDIILRPLKRSYTDMLEDIKNNKFTGRKKWSVMNKYDAVKFFVNIYSSLTDKPTSTANSNTFLSDSFIKIMATRIQKLVKDTENNQALKNANDLYSNLLQFLNNDKVLEILRSNDETSKKVTKIFNVIKDTTNTLTKGFLTTFGYELCYQINLFGDQLKNIYIGVTDSLMIKDAGEQIYNKLGQSFEKSEFYYGKVLKSNKTEIGFEFDQEENKDTYNTYTKVEMPILALNVLPLIKLSGISSNGEGPSGENGIAGNGVLGNKVGLSYEANRTTLRDIAQENGIDNADDVINKFTDDVIQGALDKKYLSKNGNTLKINNSKSLEFTDTYLTANNFTADDIDILIELLEKC